VHLHAFRCNALNERRSADRRDIRHRGRRIMGADSGGAIALNGDPEELVERGCGSGTLSDPTQMDPGDRIAK
jgi:hypothetical protein